jgi:hypothetical protein
MEKKPEKVAAVDIGSKLVSVSRRAVPVAGKRERDRTHKQQFDTEVTEASRRAQSVTSE